MPARSPILYVSLREFFFAGDGEKCRFVSEYIDGAAKLKRTVWSLKLKFLFFFRITIK